MLIREFYHKLFNTVVQVDFEEELFENLINP